MALHFKQELQNKYPHLEVSVLKYSDAMTDNDSKRIDSEFFKKQILSIDELLNKFDIIYFDENDIVSGPFGSTLTSNSYTNVGIGLIRVQDIKDGFFIDKENLIKISEEDNERIKNSELVTGDFVISKVGNIGCVAQLQDDIARCNISENNIGIKTKRFNDELKKYILVFLNSKYGQMQILRRISGNVQPKINVGDFSKIKIPLFPLEFQQQIEQMVRESHECLEQSKGLYREAEVLLYRELGLDPENPLASIEPHSGSLNISVRPLSQSLNATGRLDSEYYQQKYDEIEKVIKNYRGGYCKLKDIVVNRSGGFAFSSDSYLENGKLALIRINNIKNASLDLQNIVYLPDDAELLSPKDKICKNDILISMSGSIGLCCVIREEINAMVNQRILKISVSKFEENVLCLIINSICCKLQLQRIGTGGVQTNISGDDILNILIPKINPQTQTQIAEKIKQSFTLRKKASELLQTAKQSVENAIEKG